MSKIEKCQR